MPLDVQPVSDEVLEWLVEVQDDPYEFALGAFDWDHPELQGFELEEWQVWVLKSVKEGLLDLSTAVLLAVTSGHGIGKSALVAILLLWAISTMPDTKGVVTANTENQLKTKTWAEVAKWYRLFIAKDMFVMTATALLAVDPDRQKTWRIDMVPWSEKNTEAFAGLHNAGKRIIVIFDEASAIPDIIHEVTEGALTDKDTQIIWAMFGNPTRNTGRFREAHEGGKFAHRWKHRAVDSRTVSFTNKDQINRWIEDRGEDSDFVRIRVRGMFPRVDSESFISYSDIREAMGRVWIKQPPEMRYLIGVDVGIRGDNSCVYPRRGLDARSILPDVFKEENTRVIAQRTASMFHKTGAIMVYVDEGGPGFGVVDSLRYMGIPVYPVNFGRKALDYGPANELYANMRAYLWGGMRHWIRTGGLLPEALPNVEVPLEDQLLAPTYELNGKEEILLESKRFMRSRGVASPDVADGLALTFTDPYAGFTFPVENMKAKRDENFNPFAVEEHYGI